MLFTSNFMKLFLFFALFTKHVDNVTTEARIYMQCAVSSQNLAPVAEYFVSKSHKYHLHQNHIAGSFSLVKFMGREDSQEKLPDLRQTKYKSQSETENMAAHPGRSEREISVLTSVSCFTCQPINKN